MIIEHVRNSAQLINKYAKFRRMGKKLEAEDEN